MSVLLVAEISGSQISIDATSKALAAVSSLGPVTILAAGEGVDPAPLAALAGVDKVLHVEGADYGHQMPEAYAKLLQSLAPNYTHIAAPATTSAKASFPRLAALLDVMVITDVIAVDSADTFQRPIYAGNAIQTVTSTDAIKVMTIRTAGFDAVADGGAASIEVIDAAEAVDSSRWVEDRVVTSDRPELTSAGVVVSGGRGVGSEESFAIISALADTLGGAVGASRAAVDSGFAANDMQVGQTGKVVAPDLYIACGISGAIQHLAGMKDSKVIVAINSDSEAPIFQVADYGLVADLFDAVPALTEQLK
ncbi:MULTISPECIES: electron transfer flavoprotein subunit alpha/FixB family protein [Pacificibacter]|uniref:electron transfer flavoprotein subunit alpha/FixB family protein n=1 Tax=Pacificibacter TaxID=1042323 RepID=UPI001C095A1C|nr:MULTISPECIES: electron transfer flavoprotein subunit alpha/FixB family protein [Pacificibacter]MBU2936770.1 electron transfer flavoprotein subunit alpha/FixB family protein [Pacificibacter marinus]MDO6614762.1 electron transfer flavoprotein subunit alpha/FixB family protein [Pacificibacter sp. 1_MG-2023]